MNQPMNLMQMVSRFPNFMYSMRGQNPDTIINNMVSSGKISAQQLEQVKQQANGIMNTMSQFKSMFGFK